MLNIAAELLRSTVAGRYFLREVVSAGEEFALYSADAPDRSRVHVRLAQSGSALAERWKNAVESSAVVAHSHLLRYFEAGECSIDGQPYAYLVHELVSDRVADALEERALTPEEADMVVRAALSALGHLHEVGYFHGDMQVDAVVAASDDVKLTGERVAKLPADETDAHRAISADLMGLGQITTELLTRQTGPGAAAALPAPYAEFVRATAGNSAVPHPRAQDLLHVLDGGELAGRSAAVADEGPEAEAETAAAPVARAGEGEALGATASGAGLATSHVAPPPPPAPAPAPVRETPVVARPVAERPVEPPPVRREFAPPARPEEVPDDSRREAGRRNGMLFVGVFGVIVVALLFWVMRRSPAEKTAAPTAVQTSPATPAPSPVAPTQPQTPRAAHTGTGEARPRPTTAGQWSVIAATYADYGAALKRARSLESKGRNVSATVVPGPGQGKRYYVLLGTARSKGEAEALRNRMRSAGMPRDTYVTKLEF